ncbi:MAG: CO dehydrogenase/acetyl-CoA synthase complex subunit epsilon [Promethearchaeota archaeon]
MVKPTDPWQTAEIAGPKKAIPIKAETVAARIKRSSRSILVVGHLAAEDYSDNVKMIDYAIQLSNLAGIPVVATAHTAISFIERDFQPARSMSAMDIGNRLKDQEWKGLDGKGVHDLALFMGLPYYMEFVILAGIKHFSPELETISLDRFYHPHSTRSFPNLSVEDWNESFKVILSKLGEK